MAVGKEKVLWGCWQLDSWAATSSSHSSSTLKAAETLSGCYQSGQGVISGRDLPEIEPLATGHSKKSPYLEPLPALLATWPSHTGDLGLEIAFW